MVFIMDVLCIVDVDAVCIVDVHAVFIVLWMWCGLYC